MKSTTLYQGLFLAFLALYLSEKEVSSQLSNSFSKPDAEVEETAEGNQGPNLSLDQIYKKLKKVPVLNGNTPNLFLRKRNDEVEIILKSQDLYPRLDTIELSENEKSLLDSVGEVMVPILKSDMVVKVLVIDPNAGSNFLGNDLSIPLKRARWIHSHLEAQFQKFRSRSVEFAVQVRDQIEQEVHLVLSPAGD